MTDFADTPRLTVFYDGACPLCLREIRFYRGLRGGERLAWVDVSRPLDDPRGQPRSPADDMVAPGLCRLDALARFHVLLPDGRVQSGARGFLALWRALPGLRPIGTILSVPPIPSLMEPVYRLFLKLRPALQRLAARRR